MLSKTASQSRDSKDRARPFVKWAGGKRSAVDEILRHLPDRIPYYHEPFVGGGALFFALEDRIDKAYLADANLDLIRTYQAVKNNLKELIRALEQHDNQHNKKHYLEVRKQEQHESKAAAAARFIYLNRTCFNGLYRVNKSGRFNVPMGRYRKPLICDHDNLTRVSAALQKADLREGSFEDTKPAAGHVVYCDPPYDETYNSYTHKKFNSREQKELAELAAEWAAAGAKVIISNSDTRLIREFYPEPEWKLHSISAPRLINCKASGRKPVGDLLIVKT